MSLQKVAIVTDNNLAVTQNLLKYFREEFGNLSVFEAPGFEYEKFNLWKSYKTAIFFERLDLSAFDLVISLSVGFANGVVTNLDTKHINILVDFVGWYFQNDNPILKQHSRSWLQTALHRADENYYLYEYTNLEVQKVAGFSEYKCLEFVTKAPLTANKETEDYFIVWTGKEKTDFSYELAKIFNTTAKMVYFVGDPSGSSEYVKYINPDDKLSLKAKLASCKGVIFDSWFKNYDLLNEVFAEQKPVFSYRNGFIDKYFLGKVYQSKDLESLNDEMARFVSWAKLKDNFAKESLSGSLEKDKFKLYV